MDRPPYEAAPSREDRALGRPIGQPEASQRAGLPDIYYLWGPGRLLASQILGVSGVVIALSIVLSLVTLDFTLDTLGLLLGRFPE